MPSLCSPLAPAKGKGPYQVVSGFRRLAAIQQLHDQGHWANQSFPVIIRTDLADDIEAAKSSVIENHARATYSDLDRANAIVAMRKLGISDQEIQQTFEIGERQVQRLLQLTDLPPNLSQAVATSQIKSTLALRLMQHARKHPSTDIDYWLNWIIANNASVSSLSAALRKHLSKAPRPPLATYTSNSARIRSTRIDHNLSPAQRKNLLKQLHTLINFINNL